MGFGADRHVRKLMRWRKAELARQRRIGYLFRFEFNYPAQSHVRLKDGSYYWRTTTPDGAECHYLVPPPPSERPTEPFEWPSGWVSLGYTEEGKSESWTPSREPEGRVYLVEDEMARFRTHTEGGGIDGAGGRVDWVFARKPGDA